MRVGLDVANTLKVGEYYMYFFEQADLIGTLGGTAEYNLSSHYFIME